MLKISDNQLATFNDVAEGRFEAHLAETLNELLPKAVARINGDGKIKLLEAIRTGRERAATYQIEDPVDTAVFIAFLIAATDFDHEKRARLRDWTTPFLQRADSPGRVRLALAENVLRRKAPSDPLAAQLCSLAESLRKAF